MAHFYLVEHELAAVGGIAVLEGAEAKHAAAVSRIRVGERVAIGDGAGVVVEGPVEESSPSRVAVRIEIREETPEPAVRLTLVQALAKGDRDELAVQAVTELGVDAVVPWQAARSVSRWDSVKAVKGRERWASIVREATKQSLRPRLPEVDAVTTSAELVARMAGVVENGGRVLVLAPGGAQTLVDAVAGVVDGTDVLLVVGPEGGIGPEEIAAFERVGARTVRLGAEVLRTSTAGPAALAALSVSLGRWA